MRLFCRQSFRFAGLRLWGAWALASLASVVQAQTVPDATVYQSVCMTCHRSPLHMASQAADPSYPSNHKILTWSALNETSGNSQIIAAMRNASLLSNDDMRNSYFSYISALTDPELLQLYTYLRAVRDTVVTSSVSAFPATQADTESAAKQVKILNLRGAAVGYNFALQGTDAGDFRLALSSGCTFNGTGTGTGNGQIAAASGAATPATCTLDVFFKPRSSVNTTARNDARITIALSPTGTDVALTQPSAIALSGTASGLAPPSVPGFAPSGFDALSSFSAAPTGSQTVCPTIQNSGTANLTLAFSAVQAVGSSADYSPYFEHGDSASCPATPRACNTTLPAGSPISGGTTLAFGASPADSACTLALRFNPAKFGDAGGTGARSTTLRVTHNAPTAGTVSEYLMTGNVTNTPQPRIGLFTSPGVVGGRVSPPAFASQPVNTASTLWNEFLVFNTGTADGLDLTEVTLTNSQEFVLTESCIAAAPLARTSGGNAPSCTIGLRFTPTATGERCTTVTIRAAASSNGAQSLSICGTGVEVEGPAFTLSRTAIDFGRRSINGAYPVEPLTIDNGVGGTSVLQVNSVSLVGTGFAVVPDIVTGQTPCAGTVLAPGSNCTVQVQFTPDPTRPETPYSATLQVDTNDAATPRRTVALTAVAGTVATPPVLQFANAAAQIDFSGFVIAGQQSAQALTVTLRNAGPGNAAIDAIRMVGADASSFSASGCSAILAEGASCDISVRFVPGSGGLKRAQLEILSSLSVTPSLITVTGRGVGGTSAYLTASAANLSLGSVRVGAQSAPLELRLASAGDGVIQVTGMQVGAPFTVQSKSCPAVPFTLPRGGDCTVTVTFTPTEARGATATLLISTDADSKALEVPLLGTGEEKANVSGGGCSMASGDALADPTLWTLVLLAIAALLYRNRARTIPRPRP